MKKKFRILVEPWATYVKDADFFEAQGGLREPWGKNWREVEAEDIEAARAIGDRETARAKAGKS